MDDQLHLVYSMAADDHFAEAASNAVKASYPELRTEVTALRAGEWVVMCTQGSRPASMVSRIPVAERAIAFANGYITCLKDLQREIFIANPAKGSGLSPLLKEAIRRAKESK